MRVVEEKHKERCGSDFYLLWAAPGELEPFTVVSPEPAKSRKEADAAALRYLLEHPRGVVNVLRSVAVMSVGDA